MRDSLGRSAFHLGFERSLILDVLLTGLSILLEFWALVALRIREPELARPFRVPGGMAGAIAIGVPPLALMIAAVVRNRAELVGSTNELVDRNRHRRGGSGALFSQPMPFVEKMRRVRTERSFLTFTLAGEAVCGAQ